MAIYHLSIKPVQRSKGRSAVAAIAYRAGERLHEERTDLVHDYTRKQGVDHTQIIGINCDRATLWNMAENVERRKDATTAREYEIALPFELTNRQKIALAEEYGEWLHQRHGVAVDVCCHDLNSENPHAHILTTTRVVTNGQLGDKAAREWSDAKRKKEGLPPRKNDLEEAREKWADLANLYLDRIQVEHIDHRSLEAQGIERAPTVHLGPTATALERKGIATERGERNRMIQALNRELRIVKAKMKQFGEYVQEVAKKVPSVADEFNQLLGGLKKSRRGEKSAAQSMEDLAAAFNGSSRQPESRTPAIDALRASKEHDRLHRIERERKKRQELERKTSRNIGRNNDRGGFSL